VNPSGRPLSSLLDLAFVRYRPVRSGSRPRCRLLARLKHLIWRARLISCRAVIASSRRCFNIPLVWRHITFRTLVPLSEGFWRVERIITEAGRPLTALCACELRSPAPFTEQGFRAFNEIYVGIDMN
jgi:hypothetical protein